MSIQIGTGKKKLNKLHECVKYSKCAAICLS